MLTCTIRVVNASPNNLTRLANIRLQDSSSSWRLPVQPIRPCMSLVLLLAELLKQIPQRVASDV